MTVIDVTRIDELSHSEAMSLQARELSITLTALRSLTASEWDSPTDCPDWDVRAMYQHVLGACESGASMRENMHQLRLARSFRKHFGGPLEAALSAVQVRERSDITPTQIVERLASVAPRTVKGRTRTPSMVRNHAKLAVDGPVYETWKMGYLIDTIYLRDLWMHRVDLSHALNRPFEIEVGHDTRIIADVVAEWARRHGQPFLLELTGPAGDVFEHESKSPESQEITIDAVEFCRTLAGRSSASGLLTTVVPF